MVRGMLLRYIIFALYLGSYVEVYVKTQSPWRVETVSPLVWYPILLLGSLEGVGFIGFRV